MNFRLACEQVVLHETAANLSASWHKANDFFTVFFSFELGGITKHFKMIGPTGNSYKFVTPSNLNVEGLMETKLTVSPGASHYTIST